MGLIFWAIILLGLVGLAYWIWKNRVFVAGRTGYSIHWENLLGNQPVDLSSKDSSTQDNL